jgi:hypothetical protein
MSGDLVLSLAGMSTSKPRLRDASLHQLVRIRQATAGHIITHNALERIVVALIEPPNDAIQRSRFERLPSWIDDVPLESVAIKQRRPPSAGRRQGYAT